MSCFGTVATTRFRYDTVQPVVYLKLLVPGANAMQGRDAEGESDICSSGQPAARWPLKKKRPQVSRVILTIADMPNKDSFVGKDGTAKQPCPFPQRKIGRTSAAHPQRFSAPFYGDDMQEAGKGQRRTRRSEGSTPEITEVSRAASQSAKNEAEEPAKAMALRPGDLLTAAQELLMIEHLPIVRFIARRIHERLPQHVPIEDLYSAGVVGLLDAFGKFDPSKQVQFRSYAQFRIRGAILDSLRTLDWSPRELRRKGRAIEQAIQALTAQFGRSPSDTEIAKHLHIDLACVSTVTGRIEGARNRYAAFRAF